MKYETYKKLTLEQKEEYNYRFKDKGFIAFFTGIQMAIFSFIIATISLLIRIYDSTIQIMILINLVNMLFIVAIFCLIYGLVEIIYTKYQEYKWKKRKQYNNRI